MCTCRFMLAGAVFENQVCLRNDTPRDLRLVVVRRKLLYIPRIAVKASRRAPRNVGSAFERVLESEGCLHRYTVSTQDV